MCPHRKWARYTWLLCTRHDFIAVLSLSDCWVPWLMTASKRPCTAACCTLGIGTSNASSHFWSETLMAEGEKARACRSSTAVGSWFQKVWRTWKIQASLNNLSPAKPAKSIEESFKQVSNHIHSWWGDACNWLASYHLKTLFSWQLQVCRFSNVMCVPIYMRFFLHLRADRYCPPRLTLWS